MIRKIIIRNIYTQEFNFINTLSAYCLLMVSYYNFQLCQYLYKNIYKIKVGSITYNRYKYNLMYCNIRIITLSMILIVDFFALYYVGPQRKVSLFVCPTFGRISHLGPLSFSFHAFDFCLITQCITRCFWLRK